ncbi:TetR/AcrR family transcriptional regulator [Bradyrhizobium sp. JYMT SZCCT0180]|uniref:TetR/AcrR family transcriptional regulator n=1 Tax=Bradyrhizobium sp. JYMT SZCCT0180 TaxID=2807666 RepID=UPI001BAAEF6E|nr:TetR/AcrR family transcriptional regulator [Bradyrhizobium sp. JYMT SZCCT0180]MBR1214886.1 TetR/AcrR family transcriptional regulator [Bradyrhizobium sp. JYMT SZCCT0180]
MVQKRNPPLPPRARPKAKTEPAKPQPAAGGVPPKRRGRPRAYEPDVALSRALDVFWKDGFAATSLDDLSAATGMNRPSLYGAFGDKRELYKKTYESYRNRARARMGEAFAADMPLRPMLLRIYGIALDMYLSGEDGPRGCFTVMTATSEAVFDPDIRALVVSGLGEMDRFFARLFKIAQERGELPASADPQVLANLASATIHTIAIRARAQIPRTELETLVNGAVDVMVRG